MNRRTQVVLALLLLVLAIACGGNQARAGTWKRLLAAGHLEPMRPSVRDKWALLIGVNQYQDPAIVPLPTAARNVNGLVGALTDPMAGRFAPDHVMVLTGAAATRAGIEAACHDWLVHKALPDDVIVVYVSARLLDAAEEGVSIATFDTLLDDPGSPPLVLAEFLGDLRRRIQSPYILCLLDTSPNKPAGNVGVDPAALSATGVSMLAASRPGTEPAGNPRTGHSLFVDECVEALHTAGGLVPLAHAAEYVRSRVSESLPRNGGPQACPVFSLAPDSAAFGELPLGLPVKSSQPPRPLALGHPLDRLAIEHPDLVQPRLPSKPPAAGAPARPKTASLPPVPRAVAEDDDGDVDPHLDFGEYMRSMKAAIQGRWHPPKGLSSRRLVAVFTIRRDGTIVRPTIIEGSGLEALDRSALEALKAASPLAPLPRGAPPSVDIRYSFDWQTKAE